MSSVTRLQAITVALLFLSVLGVGRARAQGGADPSPQLQLVLEGDTLSFRLTGRAAGDERWWILQASTGLDGWDDVLFFEGKPGGDLELELAIATISRQARPRHFFRARSIEVDDPLLREFLAARDIWRRAGIGDYTMEVRWNPSFFFWHGTVSVRNHEVLSAETIETNFFEEPEPRTMDDWFDVLKSAIDQKADRIVVTYDPVFAYPNDVFIDQSFMIADEEQSWSILDFQPGA